MWRYYTIHCTKRNFFILFKLTQTIMDVVKTLMGLIRINKQIYYVEKSAGISSFMLKSKMTPFSQQRNFLLQVWWGLKGKQTL